MLRVSHGMPKEIMRQGLRVPDAARTGVRFVPESEPSGPQISTEFVWTYVTPRLGLRSHKSRFSRGFRSHTLISKESNSFLIAHVTSVQTSQGACQMSRCRH